MTESETHHCAVAIVGGGCSGLLVAAQLFRNGFRGQVSIIEPRERLGAGLAYSTPFDQHLLNVPAGKMSALPVQPSHFLEWLRTRHWPDADTDCFAPRRLYGQYLNHLLQESLTLPGVAFRHIRGLVTRIDSEPHGARLTLNGGAASIQAEKVVLALGNPASSPFRSALRNGLQDRWHLSPWYGDALRVRFEGERVLILGTGLTAVDAALALQSQDTACQVYMLSRGGILPQVHKPGIPGAPPRNFQNRNNLRLLVRELREQVETAPEAGLCWRSVVDSLRPASNDIWKELSLEERRRFLRHVKRYWEPHRHRMAPEIRSRLDRSHASGTLQVIAGRLRDARSHDGITLLRVVGKRGGERILEVDRIISCTGIHEEYSETARPPLGSLIENGLALANELGIGFRTDGHGALIDAKMVPSKVFFTLGPPRRGEQFETTAVPEIRTQAEALAIHLACGK